MNQQGHLVINHRISSKLRMEKLTYKTHFAYINMAPPMLSSPLVLQVPPFPSFLGLVMRSHCRWPWFIKIEIFKFISSVPNFSTVGNVHLFLAPFSFNMLRHAIVNL